MRPLTSVSYPPVTSESYMYTVQPPLTYNNCTSRWRTVSIQTQRMQAPANRNGRSKQPIIEAANQTLASLAVFVYATRQRCVRCVWMETGLDLATTAELVLVSPQPVAAPVIPIIVESPKLFFGESGRHHYCSIIQLLIRTRRSVYAFMYMSHIIISGKAVQCAYISLRPTTGNRCRYYVGSNCNCNSTSVRRYCPTGCNECLHYPVNLATTIRARTLLGFLLENLNFYLLYLLLWPRKEL